MRFHDFIDALYECGWKAPNDAQHENIKELWRKLFPIIAELEEEVADLEHTVEEYGQRLA